MTHSNDIKGKMKSVEMIQNENKKVWITPELDVLDGKKTFSGFPEGQAEDDCYDPDLLGGCVPS